MRGFILGIRKDWGEGNRKLIWKENKGIIVSTFRR